LALEQEIKLTADGAEVLDRVLADPRVRRLTVPGSMTPAREFNAVYFDTEDRRLFERRWSFRVRREGERWVAALKWGGALVDGVARREELEEPLGGPISRARELPAGELRARLSEAVDEAAELSPLVTVTMLRTALDLALENVARAEMVADRGRIEAGGRLARLYEIELEGRAGPFAPVARFGRELAHDYGLVPSTRSKHEIGLALLR